MKEVLLIICLLIAACVAAYYGGYRAGKNATQATFMQNSINLSQKTKTRFTELKNKVENINKKDSEVKKDENCSSLFVRIPVECVRKSTAYYTEQLR